MRLHSVRRVVTNLLGTLVVAASCASCNDMLLLETGTCGNFVIDPGEDCDGHPLENGTTCVGPEKPNACRQVCNESISCPTGWGCGNDGICRQPSGSFTPLGDTLPLAAPIVMYSGDFDGDKTTDILLLGHENSIGTRSARIAYSQPGSASMDVRSLAENMASPVIVDADGDGGALDVAFATLGGISLLLGTRNRTTEYSVFPYFSVPEGALIRVIPTNVFPDIPGDEIIAFMDHPNGKSTLSAFNGDAVETLITLDQGVDAIAGNVGRGRFDQNSSCEQIIFAHRGANEVQVYSPCRTDGVSGWNVGGSPTTIKLPPGVSVDDGVLVADLDFDGRLDVLIGTNGKPHVAWGNGDGTFLSSKPDGKINTAGPHALPMAVASNPEFPLAVADLNADAMIDFVFPQGVLVSNNGGYAFAYQNLDGAWTTAVIADLNANGLDDVIAGSSESIDLNFLNNAGAGVFNPSTIPTEGLISFLAVADFDGDLIHDVAVVQSLANQNDTLTDSLSIGFGKSHGPPENLLTMGQLESASQIAPVFLPNPENGDAIVDGIADLLAVDQHTIEMDGTVTKARHVNLFRGNSARALHTSRPLTGNGIVSRPLAIAIAQFDDEAPEIAALGADVDTNELRLWTIEGSEADLARPGPTLPPGFHPLDKKQEVSFHYGAYMASGDLDHDGTDEIVVVAPFGNAADGTAIVIADFDDDDDTFVPRSPEPISAALSVDNRFELHDIDGDGHLDGVLSTGTHEHPGDLIVLWGDGQGQLRTNAPDHVRPDGGIGGFACLPAKVGCRLVLASSSGTYSTSLKSGRRIELARIDELPAASAIATGDFNGDGLVDIALLAQEGLAFYRAVPVNP